MRKPHGGSMDAEVYCDGQALDVCLARKRSETGFFRAISGGGDRGWLL